jgi:predicted methyltransferase
MLISGIPMHRIKDTDPRRDTLAKIKTLKPVAGQVLDTSTGLGYTAIEAAKSAEKVITVEIDPAVLEICGINPWSHRLFEDKRIESRIGDVFEEIKHFENAAFSRVIHDPPTISLAGSLYSAEFYEQLVRVLAPGGRLFHYVGDLTSRSGGRTSRGVVQRLKDVGFRRVVSRIEAFGVVAYR